MVRAIIFDFFDVLRTDAYKAWLAKHDFPHTGGFFDASYQQDMGNITTDEFLARLSELCGWNVTVEELDASATVDYAVVAIAESLRPRYRTALLSNAPSAFIRKLLADHDLERYFDEIIVSSEVGLVKPSPAIFNLALKRLGVQASETLFIDDNQRHTQAAEQMGIKGIQFISAKQLKADLVAAGVQVANTTAH